ncbi:MAG TPA: 30S ribosomal protein S14 [Cyclobacteriaceae bacterium]|nr:30S ribosomal protein S14 [Cyclobacteriaceae bacterium]MCB9237230.1 30S ribosomal protein S14 [Flammeovirgaceae bacterium]MCB0499952.1 30S ribosomal protein S14 [Cyclobacteriaceae bacterium]MCO5270940.1 30S ribosomal protein S14 [Cyclobacteriaceae bacterium]MCW5901774.1 30S ribosomal protein S14 [Cyclobacteriaceae bacterium]
MAKLSIVARDRKKEALVKRYAAKRAALKEAGDWEGLDKLPRSSSRVRMRNRCKLTGRPRGYMRKFGICRNQFRQMASDGLIPGVTKASW